MSAGTGRPEAVAARAAATVGEAARADSAALETLLASRSHLYLLFHKLLGATPDEAVLDALLSDATAKAVGGYASEDDTMRGLAAFLGELAAREDRAGLLDGARDEYARLLIGPAALPALPHESPYRTKEPTLFQENTLAVRAAYRERGLQAKRFMCVPDDHVALMCAFMAAQAPAALEALRAGDLATLAAEARGQLEFVSAHMASWLGAYAVAVRRSKTAVLYPQLIEALAAFARLDATLLSEAAFWAETLVAEGFQAAGPLGAEAGSPEAAAVAGLEAAFEELSGLRPFGIEDNELVAALPSAGAK